MKIKDIALVDSQGHRLPNKAHRHGSIGVLFREVKHPYPIVEVAGMPKVMTGLPLNTNGGDIVVLFEAPSQ